MLKVDYYNYLFVIFDFDVELKNIVSQIIVIFVGCYFFYFVILNYKKIKLIKFKKIIKYSKKF